MAPAMTAPAEDPRGGEDPGCIGCVETCDCDGPPDAIREHVIRTHPAADRALWQCPRCPFQVRGAMDGDLLAEVQRSHGRRHRIPARLVRRRP